MSDDVVRTITIKGTTDGVDQATDSVNKLGDAMVGVSVASDTTSKSTLSVQTALDRQQRSLDSTYRSQQQYGTSQKVINDALNQGLIGQDKANQLLQLAQQRFDNATKSASPLTTAVKGIQSQVVALAAGLGPAGVLLASFGPWGLAAAAGIGLVVAVMEDLAADANNLGALSVQLVNTAESAGLTTTQIQVLDKAGASVMLTSEQVATSFEKFNTQLAQLKDGSGNLLTQLDKFNPALALQLSQAKDSATAWNILAQAYANASQQQQILIDKAVTGNRGGAGVGRLLGATAQAGGIGGLQAQTNPNDILGNAQTQQLATLKIAIDQIKASTQNIWASIFSDDVLLKELQSATYLKQMAEQAKLLADAGVDTGWLAQMVTAIADLSAGAIGETSPPETITPAMQLAAAKHRLGTGLNVSSLTGGNATTNWAAGTYQGPDPSTNGLAVQATQAKNLVTVLGSAATAQEQLTAKTLELDAALDKGTISRTTYNRAVSGLQLQSVIQLEGQRISLLGQAATVSDVVTQKENEITAARMKGVVITQQEAAGIIASTAAQKQSQDTALLTTNNVVTADQLRASKLADLNALMLQQKLTQDQVTLSSQAYEKQIEQTTQAQEVSRASLTQLKQLEIDSGSVRIQLDTLTTGSLNQMTTSLADMTTGTKSASQAFSDLGNYVVRAIEEMIIKMTIVTPIAAALQATLKGTTAGGFNFLGFLGLGGSNTPLAGSLPLGQGGIGAAHGGAIVGSEATFTRYIHPAYFDDAPRYHSGGLIGNEVPIIAQRGEGVFTAGQMAALGAGVGGGGDINVTVNNAPADTSADVTKSKDSSGNTNVTITLKRMIEDQVNSMAADRGSSFNRTLRRTVGTNPASTVG